MIAIGIANQQDAVRVDRREIRRAVRAILEDAGIAEARVSVAVVDDATIRPLNRQYLDHDYATDVLSFVLEQSPGWLEGEVIVSAETAAAAAPEFGWSATDELLLYVIHAALHLVGYRDRTAGQRAEMRDKESDYLRRFGRMPPEPASRTVPATRSKRKR